MNETYTFPEYELKTSERCTAVDACDRAVASVVAFHVEPVSGGQVETGGEFQFLAYVEKSDGTREVVTTESVWSSSHITAATVGAATGLVTGVMVAPVDGSVATQEVTITASYTDADGKVWQDTGQITAYSACSTNLLDIVLVLDRSLAVGMDSKSGMTQVNVLKLAAQNMVSALNATRDRMAIVTYAGDIYFGDDGLISQTDKEATIDQTLTADATLLETALDSYTVRGTEAFRGIGGGLEAARKELVSGRHRAGAKQVIVLVTTGENQITDPDPEEEATGIKQLGMTLVIVGIDVPSTYVATLQAIASPERCFFVDDAEMALGILGGLPHYLCHDETPYGNPYDGEYGNPYDNPFVEAPDEIVPFADEVGLPAGTPFISQFKWAYPGVGNPLPDGFLDQQAFAVNMLESEFAQACQVSGISPTRINLGGYQYWWVVFGTDGTYYPGYQVWQSGDADINHWKESGTEGYEGFPPDYLWWTEQEGAYVRKQLWTGGTYCALALVYN